MLLRLCVILLFLLCEAAPSLRPACVSLGAWVHTQWELLVHVSCAAVVVGCRYWDCLRLLTGSWHQTRPLCFEPSLVFITQSHNISCRSVHDQVKGCLGINHATDVEGTYSNRPTLSSIPSVVLKFLGLSCRS